MARALLRFNGMNDHELTLRETARGIAIRAAVLGAGTLILSAVVAAEAMKAAGTMMKIAAGTGLLLVGGGMAALEIRRISLSLRERVAQSAG